MVEFLLFIQNQFQERPQFFLNLLYSIFAVLGLWLLRRWIYQLGTRKVEDARALYSWRKSTTYLYYLTVVILLGFIWLGNLENLATYIGLVTAGLAIALSDPITNIAGWIYILWRRPFLVGERIQMGEHAGDVIDLELFQFTLLEIGNWVDADQRTGRMIHIPNKMVFAEPLANYSKGFQYIWNEIPVMITFESDWRKCKGILKQIISKYDQNFSQDVKDQLEKTAQEFLIDSPETNATVFTDVKDSGVLLTIRYLCNLHQRRVTTEVIWEEILDAFSQNANIELAYPTVREIHDIQQNERM